jgi:hypothetical protein
VSSHSSPKCDMDCGSLIPLWIRSAHAVGIRILQTRAFTPMGPTNSKWIVEDSRTSQRFPEVSKAVSSHSSPKCDMDCGSLIPLWIRSAYAVGIRILQTRAFTLTGPTNSKWIVEGSRTSQRFPEVSKAVSSHSTPKKGWHLMCFVGFSFFVGGLHWRACIRRMIG